MRTKHQQNLSPVKRIILSALLIGWLPSFLMGQGVQPFHEQMELLLQDTLLDDSEVGIAIYDLTADRMIYTHQAQKLYRPASIMKVLTAVTALDRLGKDHPIRTELFYTGQVTPDSVLHGHLYVTGAFDPTFSRTDLIGFAKSVQQAGIKQIEGKLIGNISMKDTLQWGSGWCWDDGLPHLTPLMCERQDSFLIWFTRALNDKGITLRDTLPGLSDTAPDSIMTRLACRTQRLHALLDRMMKKSDNLYAEAVFYQLAAGRNHRPYAGAGEACAVIDSLTRQISKRQRHHFADGSGLSLYNYLSPLLMVDFLKYAYHTPAIYRTFKESLPIAGIDGTLRNRMKQGAAFRRVYAKTGTLTGVCSLAGYAQAGNGHLMAFVLINQNELNLRPARRWQDKVCHVICSYKPE